MKQQGKDITLLNWTEPQIEWDFEPIIWDFEPIIWESFEIRFN